jgi:hypothetical protein
MIFLLYLSILIGIDPVETNEALAGPAERTRLGYRTRPLVAIWYRFAQIRYQ